MIEDTQFLDILHRGQEAASRRSPSMDELTDIISRLQGALVSLRWGVSGEVPMENPEVALGFYKCGHHWMLTVKGNPAVNAPLGHRIQVIDYFPVLLAALADKVEVSVVEVHERITTGNRYCRLIAPEVGNSES